MTRPARRRAPGRLVRRAAISAGAGALLTIAAAWALALRPPEAPIYGFTFGGSPRTSPTPWPEVRFSPRTTARAFGQRVLASGFDYPPAAERASGWPMLALRGWVWLEVLAGGHTTSTHRALSFAPAAGSRAIRKPLLGLSPMWPGFAADTAFYGSIAFSLWLAGTALHRRQRRAQNRCPRCGYDMTGAPSPTCPECGS
jgi:hypothetical protein